MTSPAEPTSAVLLTPEQMQQALLIMKSEVQDLYSVLSQVVVIVNAYCMQYPLSTQEAKTASPKPETQHGHGLYL